MCVKCAFLKYQPAILGLCVTQNDLLAEYKALFWLIFLFIVRTFNAMVARSNRARPTIKAIDFKGLLRIKSLGNCVLKHATTVILLVVLF